MNTRRGNPGNAKFSLSAEENDSYSVSSRYSSLIHEDVEDNLEEAAAEAEVTVR